MYSQATVRLAEAIAAAGREDRDAATQGYEDAVRLYDGLHLPIEGGQARVAYARALRAFGDEPGARARFEQARESFANIQAIGVVAEIDGELRDVERGRPCRPRSLYRSRFPGRSGRGNRLGSPKFGRSMGFPNVGLDAVMSGGGPGPTVSQSPASELGAAATMSDDPLKQLVVTTTGPVCRIDVERLVARVAVVTSVVAEPAHISRAAGGSRREVSAALDVIRVTDDGEPLNRRRTGRGTLNRRLVDVVGVAGATACRTDAAAARIDGLELIRTALLALADVLVHCLPVRADARGITLVDVRRDTVVDCLLRLRRGRSGCPLALRNVLMEMRVVLTAVSSDRLADVRAHVGIRLALRDTLGRSRVARRSCVLALRGGRASRV